MLLAGNEPGKKLVHAEMPHNLSVSEVCLNVRAGRYVYPYISRYIKKFIKIMKQTVLRPALSTVLIRVLYFIDMWCVSADAITVLFCCFFQVKQKYCV